MNEKSIYSVQRVTTRNREYYITLKSIGPHTDEFIFGFGEVDTPQKYNLYISNFMIDDTKSKPSFKYDIVLKIIKGNEEIPVDEEAEVLAERIMRKYHLLFKSHFARVMRFKMIDRQKRLNSEQLTRVIESQEDVVIQ